MSENKVLKGINFPGLEGTYYVPEAIAVEDENGYIEIQSYVSDTVEIENLDTTLTKEGFAADANAVGEALSAKAPAGYGLGRQTGLTEITTLAQMDGTANCGWYQVSLSGETIGGMHVGTLRVDASPHVIRQTFYGYPARLTPETIVLVRVWNASLGTWSEWEYVNPPMFIGVEYRTTERWQGKAVYTKLVHIGTLPAAGNVATCAHGASATNILRCTASTSEGATIPTWFTDKYYGEIGADKNSVFVTAGPSSDYNTITCDAQIWYTKD